MRLVEGSSRALKAVHFFRGPSNLPMNSLDLTHEPHPRFLVQGHILSIGGDDLRTESPTVIDNYQKGVLHSSYFILLGIYTVGILHS